MWPGGDGDLMYEVRYYHHIYANHCIYTHEVVCKKGRSCTAALQGRQMVRAPSLVGPVSDVSASRRVRKVVHDCSSRYRSRQV